MTFSNYSDPYQPKVTYKMHKHTIKHFDANTKGRDFVVGDIHGSASCVHNFMQHVQFDPSADRIFSVGDLVDRGPSSYECLALLNESWFHAVLANHEDMMIDYLRGGQRNGYGAYWMQNGGDWWNFLTQEEKNEVFSFLDILEVLPSLITVDMVDGRKFHVIHAEFNELNHITDEDLADPVKFQEIASKYFGDGETVLWGRGLYMGIYGKAIDEHAAGKYRRGVDLHKMDSFFNDKLSHIYSGHSVLQRPTQITGQTNLDTGAYRSYHYDTGGGYGNIKAQPTWAGLTFTEPLTGKFWKATETSVNEVEVLVI